MQNNTSKMVALLGKIRKQMNGAVLDTFRYYGAKYGMNYGVAIHSLRQMALEQGVDHSLSQFLYRQQVRELQIIALWIADAKAVSADELDFWMEGIINSEMAEQAAQALFANVNCIDTLLERWCASDNLLHAYAALLSASRSGLVSDEAISNAAVLCAERFGDNHLVAQGVTNMLASRIATAKQMIEQTLLHLPDNKTAAVVREEISWRLEY